MILLDSKGRQGAGLSEEAVEQEAEEESSSEEEVSGDEDPLEDSDLPF